MIVVATNVLARLIVGGAGADDARALLDRDDEWIVPSLWRSEFRNVLAAALRNGKLTLSEAKAAWQVAAARMRFRERSVDSEQVLDLASESGLPAYDCEFVALALQARVPLVTADRRIVTAFPRTARLLSEYARR